MFGNEVSRRVYGLRTHEIKKQRKLRNEGNTYFVNNTVGMNKSGMG
jgi:hypothetical protein